MSAAREVSNSAPEFSTIASAASVGELGAFKGGRETPEVAVAGPFVRLLGGLPAVGRLSEGRAEGSLPRRLLRRICRQRGSEAVLEDREVGQIDVVVEIEIGHQARALPAERRLERPEIGQVDAIVEIGVAGEGLPDPGLGAVDAVVGEDQEFALVEGDD
jgi:hypothetical protein